MQLIEETKRLITEDLKVAFGGAHRSSNTTKAAANKRSIVEVTASTYSGLFQKFEDTLSFVLTSLLSNLKCKLLAWNYNEKMKAFPNSKGIFDPT